EAARRAPGQRGLACAPRAVPASGSAQLPVRLHVRRAQPPPPPRPRQPPRLLPPRLLPPHLRPAARGLRPSPVGGSAPALRRPSPEYPAPTRLPPGARSTATPDRTGILVVQILVVHSPQRQHPPPGFVHNSW